MIRVLLLLMIVCSTCQATEPLYRKVATWQYYYQNGCQYRRQVYTYEPYSAQTSSYSSTTTITKQDLSEDGWRGKLLEIAKQRDAWEGSMRKSAVEHGEFVDSIKILGLQNNFRWNGYGYQFEEGQQGTYGASSYSQLPAEQGSTIYGYRESADVYGNVDLGAFMNDLLRLRQQSYDNESIATSEVHSLASEMNDGQAKVAEIRAKATAAAEVLKAASPQERVSILKEYWEKGKLPEKKTNTISVSAADANTILNSRCLKCHNETKKEGDFSLVGTTLDKDVLDKILDRVTSSNPERRMPPNTSLSIQEIYTLFHFKPQ